jgi:hypothetical protein
MFFSTISPFNLWSHASDILPSEALTEVNTHHRFEKLQSSRFELTWKFETSRITPEF